MQVYRAGRLQRLDKQTIKRLTNTSLQQLLQMFVGHDAEGASSDPQHRTRLVQRICKEVVGLQEWAECSRTEGAQSWRFHSVSLLIVYEGHMPINPAHVAPEGEGGCSARVRCALIDFAHCYFGDPGPDTNFAAGLAAFRQALQSAISRDAAPSEASELRPGGVQGAGFRNCV
jgi:Inositol polyphosphate kinase